MTANTGNQDPAAPAPAAASVLSSAAEPAAPGAAPDVVPAHISSAKHPEARRVRDVLRSTAERPRTIVIDDAENIAQALAAGITPNLVCVTATAEAAAAQFAALNAQLPGLPDSVSCVSLDPAVAAELFGSEKASRVFALASAPKPQKLAALTARGSDVVVLDGVNIVGNIGAIVRTATALGASGVVLLNSGLKSIYDRRLIRASRGLVFALPVVLATRAQFAHFVAENQLPVAALAATAQQPLAAISEVKERLAIVLGSERKGVSGEVAELATHHYAIAMDERVESLNVSVTAGIALYQHAAR